MKRMIQNLERIPNEKEDLKMKRGRTLLVLGCMGLLLALGTSSCGGALESFKAEKGTVKVSGGTAHIQVMEEAAKLIMTSNPGTQITIAGGGSGVGIKQVGEGLVDIGNSGRNPADEEITRYGLKLYQWAIDGIAVVVNPENEAKAITNAQLKDIFAGKIDNWKALGGEDRRISLYTRDEASGTREVF